MKICHECTTAYTLHCDHTFWCPAHTVEATHTAVCNPFLASRPAADAAGIAAAAVSASMAAAAPAAGAVSRLGIVTPGPPAAAGAAVRIALLGLDTAARTIRPGSGRGCCTRSHLAGLSTAHGFARVHTSQTDRQRSRHRTGREGGRAGGREERRKKTKTRARVRILKHTAGGLMHPCTCVCMRVCVCACVCVCVVFHRQ